MMVDNWKQTQKLHRGGAAQLFGGTGGEGRGGEGRGEQVLVTIAGYIHHNPFVFSRVALLLLYQAAIVFGSGFFCC